MRFTLALAAAAIVVAALPGPAAHGQSLGSAVVPQAKVANDPAAFRFSPARVGTARLTLAPVDPAAVAEARQANARSFLKRVEVGLGRELGASDTGALAQARWSPVEGGRALRWEVTSSEAHAVRLGINTASLADGVEVRFAGSDNPGLVFGPFAAAEMRAAGAAWWSPVLDGSTAIVEWFVPGAQPEPRVELAQVSHLFVNPADPKAEAIAKAAGSCEVNFICRASSDSALASMGKAVTRLVITRSGGSSILCTGNLLNSNASSPAPYIASATHCISTPAEAASLDTYWFYETSSCGGTALNAAQTRVQGGSTLLFFNADSDFTLVRMNQSPPAGAVYAGWDASPVATGSAATAVHHPQGDVKKVSLGSIAGFQASSLAAGSFIRVQWNSTATGVTEGGSSGGGIFTSGASGYSYRGGLNGGASDCAAPADMLYDWYSRLDLAYPFVAQWLDPARAPALGSNQVANAGFEAGITTWQQASTSGTTQIITNDASIAHSGSWYAWLGGADGVTESVEQALTVPQGAARLQFWYRIATAETTTTRDFDRLTISVLNASGSATLAVIGTFSNLNATSAWVQSPVYDLSAFSGQSVRVQFKATTDPSNTTSFRIDDVTLSTTASLSTANQTALWWNPAESGWGLNVNQQGDTAFATLFTYDTSGAPMWLVMSAGARQAGGDAFVGKLFRTTGPAFNANPFLPIGPANVGEVGTMTVDFSSGGPSIGYEYNGAYVSKRIQKQLTSTCQNTTASRAGATNYQDLWWNPAESGWGLNVAQQGDTIFATLFTYATNGVGMWLVMPGGTRQPDGSYSGELYRTQGPAFNAQPWFAINFASVGTMRLRFQNGETGTLDYSVNGANVTKAIQRQVFSAPLPICSG